MAETSREAIRFPRLSSCPWLNPKAANICRQVRKGQAISLPSAELPGLMLALFSAGVFPREGSRKQRMGRQAPQRMRH